MTRTKQITAGLIAGVSLAAFGAAPLSAEHFTELSPLHTVYGVSQFNYADVGVDNSVYLLNPNHVTQVAAVLAYNHAVALFVPPPGCVNPCAPHVSNGTIGTCNLDTGGILFFSSGDVSVGEQPEEFLACVVVLLTPHESLQVTTPFFQAFSYVETIWSPVDPVRVRIGDDRKARRLADGLGGRTYTQAEDDLGGSSDVPGNDYLAHPGLFTLPRDDFDYLFDEFFWIQPNDQRQAAIDCVCAGVFNLRFNPFNTEVSLKVFKPFGINCPPPPIRVLLD